MAVTPYTVELLYAAMLGRKPGPDEVAHQLNAASWDELVRVIAQSDEFAARLSDDRSAPLPDDPGSEPAPPPVPVLTVDAGEDPEIRPMLADLGPLTHQQIEFIFTTLLGRAPSAHDVDSLLGEQPHWQAVVRMVVNSEEFARRHGKQQTELDRGGDSNQRINIYLPELAEYCHAPGTVTDDGIAVVGEQGIVFLVEGSNSMLAQYRGQYSYPEDWEQRWAAALDQRARDAAALGVELLTVAVPDKLAVVPELSGLRLGDGSGRPLARLTAAHPQLLYPLAELKAAGAGGYMKTDTHLSLAGNRALAAAIGTALGVDLLASSAAHPLKEMLYSGDLGLRCRPPIVELTDVFGDWGRTLAVDDNIEQMMAVGGHLGARRTFTCDEPADSRTAVVFGDSFAWSAEDYQGLTWFLGQTFAEVRFVWMPFGWDPGYVEECGADVAISLGAERFAVRPPAPRIDVRGFADRAIARGRAMTVYEVNAGD
ncbi:MAG: hypothetical protein V9E83_12975 [Baekduia sp.]